MLRHAFRSRSILTLLACLPLVLSGPLLADAPAHLCDHFVPNPGAGADTVTSASDFLPCTGLPYALCYYSGPEPMTCIVDPNGKTAACECYYVDALNQPASGTTADASTSTNYVDKTSILNKCIADETAGYCATHDCSVPNSAPVCWYLENRPDLFAPEEFHSDVVSDFSLAKVPGATIGCSNCQGGTYAGCMTAPCKKTTNSNGETIALCQCPLAKGSYQIGQDGQTCDLGTLDGKTLVWSAATNEKDRCIPMPKSSK